MTRVQLLAAASGLATVLGGVGGLSWWSSRRASAADVDDWRPKCVTRLGWDAIDVATTETADDGAFLLFGLDMSPSNEELAQTQLDAVVEFAGRLSPELGTGILLVSDRSDRSSTPDLALEPSIAPRRAHVQGLSCWPDCPTDSMFAQRCQALLEAAVDDQTRELDDELAQERAVYAHGRAERLATWHAQLQTWRPRPGTSLLRFWHKVADLPRVRRSPVGTRVVLLSDLEESGTRERAVVERFFREYQQQGSCPTQPELPDLEGTEILLLQTVTDRIRPEAWGARWEALLGCAGARVVRQRYSPGIPLDEYLAD